MSTTTIKAATPTKLKTGAWGARVEGAVSEGDIVTITTKSGKSWDAVIDRVVWTNGRVSVCATLSRDSIDRPRRGAKAPAKREPRGPQLVGERTDLCSRYEATRTLRTPHRDIGEACYLKHGGERIAVVVVGYETATYLRSIDAEDMGTYGLSSGYYGTLYYRRADEAEAAALEASPAEVARRARAEREEQIRELDGLIRAEHLTDERLPAESQRIAGEVRGVIWSGLAGHRALYLGSDGAAWRTESSYDSVPRAWRTEDARAVELARALTEA